MKPAMIMLLCAVVVAGCKREDMYTQPKNVTWSYDVAFPQALRMLRPVPGTVARNPPPQSAPQPPAITAALLARGEQRFDVDCEPCHDPTGDGDGMVVRRGFPHPPELFAPRLQAATAQHLYDVITRGHGVMYSFADRVSPADRWAIVAYIRALQRSQDSSVASLPAEQLQRLKNATAGQGP